MKKMLIMPDPTSSSVLDRAEGLRRVRGNEKLYRELVAVFLRDLPRLIGLLQLAVQNRSAKDLHAAAHSLKGSAGHLGASVVVRGAWALETMGQHGDLADMESCWQRLELDLQELTRLLQSIESEGAPLAPSMREQSGHS